MPSLEWTVSDKPIGRQRVATNRRIRSGTGSERGSNSRCTWPPGSNLGDRGSDAHVAGHSLTADTGANIPAKPMATPSRHNRLVDRCDRSGMEASSLSQTPVKAARPRR